MSPRSADLFFVGVGAPVSGPAPKDGGGGAIDGGGGGGAFPGGGGGGALSGGGGGATGEGGAVEVDGSVLALRSEAVDMLLSSLLFLKQESLLKILSKMEKQG